MINFPRQTFSGNMDMAFEPQLVPTLREGIQIVKIVLYQELKSLLLSRHREMEPAHVNNLAGAVVSGLFDVPHSEPPMASFVKHNRVAVQNASELVLEKLDHLRIPLTDALRVQFLCDSHEGKDSTAVLENAERQGILILEREVPLPGAFMNIVRSFGRAYGILDPEQIAVTETKQKNQNGATIR